MKTVGKQLQEARLAKSWTPELAARETKIKVDRLRDLEADDYSNFSSPTYARGFVRTYARFLGLDEYKILRQLDNKLPEDDNASFVHESGVAYIPEPSHPSRAVHRSSTGLHIVLALGGGVALLISFILFEAYRAGVLPAYFTRTSSPEIAAGTATTNVPPANPEGEPAARALPLDANAVDTSHAVKALPVEVDNATAAASTNSASAGTTPPAPAAGDNATAANTANAPVQAVKALPVDPSELTNAPAAVVASATPAGAPPTPPSAPTVNTDAKAPPRALPVDPSELAAAPLPATPATGSDPGAPAAPPASGISTSARQSNSGPVKMPAPPPPSPVPASAPSEPAAPTYAVQPTTTPGADKRLILTAMRDSFVRVTSTDSPDVERVLYASVLHSGQSVTFDNHKYSINVGIPSAIDITLDGVNYGPHSDQESPETFSLESHQP